MKIGIPALVHEISKAIDICKCNKYINHIEIGIDNLDECKQVIKYAKKFEENNISIGIHIPMELNTCENIDYIRESWIKFILELNKKLINIDVKYFNMHVGYVITNRFEKNKEKYLNNSIKFFKNLDIDTKIYIENTYTKGGDICNVGTTSYEFEYIFNSVPKIGFCYDTGHNLINKDDFISKLKDKLNLIHLSDNDGIKDLHIGLGKGILSIDSIKDLIKLNPQFIILEINYNDINESVKLLERFI
ncbi:sugar phosphate isomerase/epimerase family protein [Paraclostridium tenue]